MQAKLEEEQRRCSETQIELDAQRQVNADIMMQIEDQSALYRTVHAEVTLAAESHVSSLPIRYASDSDEAGGAYDAREGRDLCIKSRGACRQECMHT